jgi:hypothetical protein
LAVWPAEYFIYGRDGMADHRDMTTQRSAAGSTSALLLFSILATAACWAGDAGVPVTITRFDHSGNDYTLVVHPEKTDPPDPYIGACERFEVRGTYGLLRGANRNEAWLSRQVHREALEFLQQAFISGQKFDLASVGTGFIPIDASKPCVVKSRALRLVKDDAGIHVQSYHDAMARQAWNERESLEREVGSSAFGTSVADSDHGVPTRK